MRIFDITSSVAPRRHRRRGAAVAVAVALLATGCGSDATNDTEAVASTAAESVPDADDASDLRDAAQSEADELLSEASEAGEDIDAEGGEITVDGGASVGQDLPEGFPDDVPIAPGEVISALSADQGDTTGYSLAIQADGEVLDVTRDLSSGFESAGYTVEGLPDLSGDEFETYAFRFTGDAWEGSVIITANSVGTVVTYAIASIAG